MDDLIQEVPEELRQVFSGIVALTDAFCGEQLNDEYREICRDVAVCLCRPGSWVVQGKAAGWAAGIVCSIACGDSPADRARQPHVQAEAVAEWFGVSVAATKAKSKIIREGFALTPLDPDFTQPSQSDDRFPGWLIDVNGKLVDVRGLAREVQVAAFEEHLIPYVPADRRAGEAA